MDDPHYACAPLSEWVPGLGADAVVHALVSIPRALRGLLDPLAALGPDGLAHDVIVVVGEAPEPVTLELISRVRPGGWIVELLPRPQGLARTLLALRSDGTQSAALGYRAVQRWSAAGTCGLQQWTSVDPPDLLVTVGRRRTGA